MRVTTAARNFAVNWTRAFDESTACQVIVQKIRPVLDDCYTVSACNGCSSFQSDGPTIDYWILALRGCNDPVKTCSGVNLFGDTREHIDGRRDQAMDGPTQERVGA